MCVNLAMDPLHLAIGEWDWRRRYWKSWSFYDPWRSPGTTDSFFFPTGTGLWVDEDDDDDDAGGGGGDGDGDDIMMMMMLLMMMLLMMMMMMLVMVMEMYDHVI